MAKIVCDVCGTSYPENASQCPICGCASSFDADFILDDTADSEQPKEGGYTYVKGGRFSKSNVRKKQRGEQPSIVSGNHDDEEEAEHGSKNGILIVAAFLLVAIIGIVIFMTIRFFGMQPSANVTPESTTTAPTIMTTETTTPTETTEATEATTEATVPPVPCTEIVISKTSVQLGKVGESILLNATPSPTDTTDEIVFSSDNTAVATVSTTGKITAVAGGEATITVTCGSVTATCKVICTMEAAPTEPTEGTSEPTTNPSEPESDFVLSDLRGRVYTDITLSYKGENYKLYNGDISVDQITWSSDNENVATFVGGVVKAVGSGTTTIYAEYNGVKRSCIVRCKESMGVASSTAPDSGSGNQGGSNSENTGDCDLSHEDVTIKIGETFILTLREKNGDPVFATWSVGNSSVCTVNNNIVTGVAVGQTTVSYTHNGTTYSCIVRVVRGG